jgi:hypothetical protein
MARHFVDARGTEWEVWEVGARRTVADAPPPPRSRRHDADGPCLRFESATQRRCLAPYPARWEAFDPTELAALCDAARPVTPPLAAKPFVFELPELA